MDVVLYYFVLFVLPVLIGSFILLISVLIANRIRYDLFKPKFEATKSDIDSFLTTMWFIVHQDLMKSLLKGLLGEDNSNKKALLKALETEI